jgi:hypothetical protein
MLYETRRMTVSDNWGNIRASASETTCGSRVTFRLSLGFRPLLKNRGTSRLSPGFLSLGFLGFFVRNFSRIVY